MSLSEEDRTAIVAYRIEKANRTLREALINFDLKLSATASNRLYYAAYHAVSALLVSEGLTAKTHRGVRAMFYKELLLKNRFPAKFGALFSQLFDFRHDDDYDDYRDITIEELAPLIEPTKEFVDTICEYASKQRTE